MTLLIIAIVLALLFDFLNGMNDAANSVATIVSTRVLSPRLAVVWATVFNFVAVFIFGVHVAETMGRGIVNPAIIDVPMILVTLISAIIWTHACTRMGFPISVSHALVGGLVGAGVAKAGFGVVVVSGVAKVVLFIVLSPLLGLFLGYGFMIAVFWIFRRSTPRHMDRWFRKLQLVSAAFYSMGHGANDAQKTMGIIAVLLFSTGQLGDTFYVPFWVVISCYSAISLGTLLGGWQVIRTLGMRMTKLKPVHGFCANASAAATIIFSSLLGVPVSTTHTITGAIIGVGATTKFSAIRWGIAYKIIWAWVLTIPTTALFAGLLWYLYTAIR